jgi:DNA-binding response OmpR family regulator
MKLLIVEDEISLLNGIKDYFEHSDFLCEGVFTFREAISRLEDFSYDCIILDINLPDGSVEIGRLTLLDWRTIAIAVVSFIFTFYFKKLNTAFIIMGGALLGYALSFV